MEFSKLLIQRRKQLGFSQEALAEKIQVSRQAISKWENGDSYPDLPKLIALSNALDISLDQLCGLNKNTEIKNTSQIETKKSKKKTLLIISIILISFLIGNILPKIGVTPIPEEIKVTDVSLNFLDKKINLFISTDSTNNHLSYSILFTSIGSYNLNKKYPLECEDGICTFSLDIDEIKNTEIENYLGDYISNTNISFVVSNRVDSKSILIIKDLYYQNGDAKWTPIE